MTDKVGSSFFVKPIRWDEGVTRGFIVAPHTVSGDRWGEPLKTEDGTRVKPGTLGGPFPNAVLGLKGNTWKSKRNKGLQDVGNIDWKGPWLSKAQTKREVVSFHGPTQRYWNNNTFVYGSEPSHNHVYSKGVVIGIAPQPVLGACIHTSADGVRWIIAVCVKGNRDLCYVTRQFYRLSASVLVDENRALAMRVSNKAEPFVDGKYGWVLLTEGLPYEDAAPTDRPDAPWFFNASGTQARTMRKAIHTHPNNNDDGVNEDDTVHREMHCVVDASKFTASFTKPDSWALMSSTPNGYARWSWRSEYRRENKVYVQPVDGDFPEAVGPPEDGYEHLFMEDVMYIDYTLKGRSKVAVDFDPETGQWVYGWVVGEYKRQMQQMWTIGIDEPNTAGQDATEPPRVPNTGSTIGPQPRTQDYVSKPEDHTLGTWVGILEECHFIINNAGSNPEIDQVVKVLVQFTNSGRESAFNGEPPDPEDTFLYFIESYQTHIQYADLRHNMLAGSILYDLVQQDDAVWVVDADEYQWVGKASTKEDNPLQGGDRDHLFMVHNRRPRVSAPTIIGWTKEEMEGWELNFEDVDEAHNFSGKLGAANDDLSLYEPEWRSFFEPLIFSLPPNPYRIPLTLDEMLYGVETQSVGVYGTTEKDESLCNIVFFNKSQKQIVSASYSWQIGGDPLVALGGGDRMHPGGLL